MEETWKRIPGYEKEYMVSDGGRVYSVRNRKILKPESQQGYQFVRLKKNKTSKKIAVHRLVASVFIPNPEGKPQVNHIDGIHDHNCVSNLEWVTAQENVIHAINNKLRIPYVTKGKGRFHHATKIILQSTLEGSPVKVWFGTSEASRGLGFNQSCISSACHTGKPYKNFYWKFLYNGKTIHQILSQYANGINDPELKVSI